MWLQVFLFNTNNFPNRSIWSTDRMQTDPTNGGMLSVTVSVVGNENSDLSSNPGWSCLHFTLH